MVDKPTFEELIRNLEHPNQIIRCSSVELLEELGDPRAIDALIERLSDTDAFVREITAKAIGKIGVNEEQLQRIWNLFYNGNDDENYVALMTLEKLGKNVQKVLQDFVENRSLKGKFAYNRAKEKATEIFVRINKAVKKRKISMHNRILIEEKAKAPAGNKRRLVRV